METDPKNYALKKHGEAMICAFSIHVYITD